MADMAAQALARHDVAAVIASPMERAQQTADPIARVHGLTVGTEPPPFDGGIWDARLQSFAFAFLAFAFLVMGFSLSFRSAFFAMAFFSFSFFVMAFAVFSMASCKFGGRWESQAVASLNANGCGVTGFATLE